jgi:protein tyrosine phosphatase (PTP) superfamily phosphohydrolase (DUF442 family)
MDAPPPKPRRFTRRTLFRLAGAGVLFGLSAEAVRVFALTNKHTVIPGLVYRTAQLDAADLAGFIRAKNIKTVVNLRGPCPDTAWYLGEARATHAAGISQEDLSLSAKRLPAPNEVRRLVDVLDHTEYPIVFHCQRGADRTGLVATSVLLLKTDATLATARRQLWPRYGHVRGGRTVVIDQFFDFYEAWLAGRPHTPDLFRRWATEEYCPGPYRAKLSLVGAPTPPEVPAGRGFTLTIRAENTSIEPWTFHPGAAGGVQLRYYLYTPQGVRLFTGHAGRIAATVPPGGHIDLVAGLPPIAEPGRYLVHADLLDTQPIDLLDADFVQYGSEPLLTDVFVK